MSFDMRAKPFDLDDNAVRWVNDTFNAMTQEEKNRPAVCGYAVERHREADRRTAWKISIRRPALQ